MFSNYGELLKKQGNLKEALRKLRKALEMKPNLVVAHLGLGKILRDLGNLKEAELSLRKSIEIEPNLPEAHSNLGLILSEFGKTYEAKNEWIKAITLQPNLTIAIEQLSRQLYFEREYEYGFRVGRAGIELKNSEELVELLSTDDGSRER